MRDADNDRERPLRLVGPEEPGPRRCDELALRASTSLSGDEVEALGAILDMLRRGGDARVLARNPAATTIATKVASLRKRIDAQRAAREARRPEMGTPDPTRKGGR